MLAFLFVVASGAWATDCAADQAPPMLYRNLGNTGLKVSALGFGAWVTFGIQIKEDQACALLEEAYRGGVNFFDNAETYGHGVAETIMGNCIQRGFKSKLWTRSHLVISTKIFWGEEWGNKPGARAVNHVGLSRKHIVEGMLGSLKRLQLDYVDIVFAHRPDSHTPMEEIVRGFNHLIDRGLTFYWGTSEWSAAEIEQAIGVAQRLGLIAPVAEQPQYNMLERQRFEGEYADVLKKGYGATIWSPIASGVLSGKYTKEGIPDGSRFNVESYSWLRDAFLSGKRHGAWSTLIDKIDSLKPVAASLNCSLAQLAIAWCLKNNHVSVVLFGATAVSQVQSNLQALRVVDLLTPAVMADIEALLGNAPAAPFDWRLR